MNEDASIAVYISTKRMRYTCPPWILYAIIEPIIIPSGAYAISYLSVMARTAQSWKLVPL